MLHDEHGDASGADLANDFRQMGGLLHGLRAGSSRRMIAAMASARPISLD